MLTLNLDRTYAFCNDRAPGELQVASAGNLTREAIADCFARHPLIARFREFGMVEALRMCQERGDLLPPSVAAQALGRPHPYGIASRAACGLCRSLPGEAFAEA